MGNEEYIIQWDDMTPEAKAKKERLEQDPSFRTDHMAYMEGMDQISTDIRDKVMSQVESYDEKVYTAADVQAALAHDVCSIEDFKALLSPAAQPFLEQMAEKAAVERRNHFGNSVYLFTPLYIANYCENYCVYCGFNCYNHIHRKKLNMQEIEHEMKVIADSGIEEILMLTGESRHMSDVKYIGEACKLASKYFRNVGLEIYPVNVDEYKYLHECGLPKERVYVTGSPMAEVLHENLEQIKKSDILERLGLETGKYILLSAHREENIDTEKNFESLFNAVNKMAEKYDMPILYSCHPRSRKRIENSGFKLDSRVIQHEPMGFHDYNNLQMNAFAVVSDSGTLPEESSFFTSVGHPFPAICIRTSTERPEALDKGCFILAGIDEKGLLQAVDTAVKMNQNGDYGIPVPDYIEENVSTKVVKIIQSYTGVVDKMVWRKQ